MSHIKVYDKEDENVSWTISVNQFTTCRDILRSVARKINVEANALALVELQPQGAENRVPEDDHIQPLKQRLEAQDVGQRLCVCRLGQPEGSTTIHPSSPRAQQLIQQATNDGSGSPLRARPELLSPRSRGASANQVPGVIPPEMSVRPLPASPLTLERRDSGSGLIRSAESPIPRRKELPPSPRPHGAPSPLSVSATSPAASAASPSDHSLPDRATSPTPMPPLRGRAAVINLGEVHPEPARKPLPVPPGKLHNFPSLPPPVLPPPPAPPKSDD